MICRIGALAVMLVTVATAAHAGSANRACWGQIDADCIRALIKDVELLELEVQNLQLENSNLRTELGTVRSVVDDLEDRARPRLPALPPVQRQR